MPRHSCGATGSEKPLLDSRRVPGLRRSARRRAKCCALAGHRRRDRAPRAPSRRALVARARALSRARSSSNFHAGTGPCWSRTRTISRARAARLLERFDFIPHARVDDLMVSYAVPGGSVGPHVDSYDVFLLQGHGRRRWQISRQQDLRFVPGLAAEDPRSASSPSRNGCSSRATCSTCRRASRTTAWPRRECLTWSVGFRAPSDRGAGAAPSSISCTTGSSPPGHYRDPGAAPREASPARSRATLAAHMRARALRAIRWSDADVREFAGRFLSEPKAQVVLRRRRARPLAARALRRARRARARPRTRPPLAPAVFWHDVLHERRGGARCAGRGAARLRELADARALRGPGRRAGAAFWDLAYAWYMQGFLHAAEGGER